MYARGFLKVMWVALVLLFRLYMSGGRTCDRGGGGRAEASGVGALHLVAGVVMGLLVAAYLFPVGFEVVNAVTMPGASQFLWLMTPVVVILALAVFFAGTAMEVIR